MITESKSGSDIKATIEGSPADVLKEMTVYFDNYSPYGYHTRVESDLIIDGIRVVHITRWNNCD